MTKIFATSKPRVFFILKDNVTETEITKCTGYFMEGIFFGVSIIKRKKLKGINAMDYKEILNSFFKIVFKKDTIKEMQKRLTKI